MIKNVAEYLDASAARYPGKVSYSDGKYELTFSLLRDNARAIATAIAERGIFKQPVLIALNKSPRVVTAFMSAAYSGNFYVPLDIEMPPERIKKIIEKLSPNVYITEPEHLPMLIKSGVPEGRILIFEDALKTIPDEKLLADAARKQIDTDLFYVLFTSGSTGMPKGVCITHKAVIDYAEQITDTFGFDENTIWGQSHPFTFDASILVIYSTLRNGGTDYILPKTSLMFPSKLIPFLNEHKVNSVFWVPTLYNNIVKSGILNKSKPEYITKYFFSGEVMHNSLLNIWKNLAPTAMFTNIFGPTEITDSYLYYTVNRDFADDEPLPIGTAYDNVESLILNDNNELCAEGEIGELCIRGSKVSPGYYNDLERSETGFVQNPLNRAYKELIYKSGDLGYVNQYGEVMFVGRKDFQIKHNGYRIELGEIESAAQMIDGISLCGCIYDTVHKQVVLYYTGTAEQKQIVTQLKAKLQPYMIPDKVIQLPDLPRTSSDKINRVELKKLAEEL